MAISRFATSSVAQGLPKYQKLWDGTTVYSDTAFESIATVTVGSTSVADITFSSIPSTYKHLQIRGILKSTVSPEDTDYAFFYLNSDTANNYATHRLTGNGSSPGASALTSTGSGNAGYIIASTGKTNIFGALIMDILDYNSSSKRKTVRVLSGLDSNGSGNIELFSTLYMSASAVNSIKFVSQTGNIAQYSSLALYGIKD
jgi:hypothetical protein